MSRSCFKWPLGLLLCSTLAGCVGGGNSMDIVARDDHFAVVRLHHGQDFTTVAGAMLADPLAAWQLREVNADHSQHPGQLVAVPLQALNPSSVYPDGYRSLPVLCYHQFTGNGDSSQRLELTAAAFEQQLRYLRDHDYQMLTMSEVAAIMREGKPIPEKAVAITIDDGYRSVFEVAWPLLQQYQARATLFIYTDFIGGSKALTWPQMQQMRASGLVDVQSHGKSHNSLARQPQDTDQSSYQARVQREIEGSAARFEDKLGYAPSFLSYPYGESSELAATLYEKAGYQLAATVTRGDNPVYAAPFMLHRTMVYASHDLEDFARMVRVFRRQALP